MQADVVLAPAAGFDPTEVADVRPVAEERGAPQRPGPARPALHPKTGVVLDGGGAVSARGTWPPTWRSGPSAADRRRGLRGGARRRPHAGQPGWGRGTLVPIVTSGRVADPAARLVVLAASDGATHAPAATSSPPTASAVLGEVADLVDWADPAGLDRATPEPQHPSASRHRGRRPAARRRPPAAGRLDAAAAPLAGALEDRTAPAGSSSPPSAACSCPACRSAPADGLAEALSRLGFVVDGTDPAAGVVACAGRPGCAAAHADTKADGHRVVERLRAAGAGRAPTVHVSGCAKRLAAPASRRHARGRAARRLRPAGA